MGGYTYVASQMARDGDHGHLYLASEKGAPPKRHSWRARPGVEMHARRLAEITTSLDEDGTDQPAKVKKVPPLACIQTIVSGPASATACLGRPSSARKNSLPCRPGSPDGPGSAVTSAAACAADVAALRAATIATVVAEDLTPGAVTRTQLKGYMPGGTSPATWRTRQHRSTRLATSYSQRMRALRSGSP